MHTNRLMAASKRINTIELNEAIKYPFAKHNANHVATLVEPADLSELDFNALVEVIVAQYHHNLRDQASLIYDLSNNLFRSDGYLYPHLSKMVELFFMFFHDMLCQFKKEEQILFPNIIHLAEKKLHERAFNYSTFGIVRFYAEKMNKQHHIALENLRALRDLTGDYRIIEGDCRSYVILMDKMKTFEEELIQHMKVESEVLIPKAMRLNEYWNEINLDLLA